VGFWGVLGHSASIPSKAYIPWVRAILNSSSHAADDLLATRHQLNETATDVTAPLVTGKLATAGSTTSAVASKTGPAISAQDLDIARRILQMSTTSTKV